MARWILLAALIVSVSSLISFKAYADCTKCEKADEVKVKLEDCPKAVQDTIKKEVGTGKIEEITKEACDGKSCYEADAVIDSKEFEIKVAEDGTLMSKKVNEDDKKDEKGKDDKK